MPRRQFIADLQEAQNAPLPLGILDLQNDEEDGQFGFTFSKDGSSIAPCRITAMIPELADYPKSHEYILYCADDAPKQIAEQLQYLAKTNRKTVTQLLEAVSEGLLQALSALNSTSTSTVPSLTTDDDMQEYDEDEEMFSDDDGDDDQFLETGFAPQPTKLAPAPSTSNATSGSTLRYTNHESRNRIRAELRAVRAAGFRIGIFGDILDSVPSYLTLSIRVCKLGISEEAMQAWQITPEEYLVLVIHFPQGYMSSTDLQQLDKSRLRNAYNIRVLCSSVHKPHLTDVLRAFTKSSRDRTTLANELDEKLTESATNTHDIFISKPLTNLLEDELVPVLRFRASGMDWAGAECCHHDCQDSKLGETPDLTLSHYYEAEARNTALPEIVTADHFSSVSSSKHSLALLIMQYTLRHFVRCTEFCMVCHRKINNELQAIKPYVCERPLCLFQYVSMGLGGSIEHELLAQPLVADLLISFCYSSAAFHKLQELPTGLSMMVPGLFMTARPHIRATNWMGPSYQPHEAEEKTKEVVSKEYDIGFDQEAEEIMFFDSPSGGCPFARGTWVLIKCSTTSTMEDEELHCRIAETNRWPTIKIDKPITMQSKLPGHNVAKTVNNTPAKSAKDASMDYPSKTPKWVSRKLIAYDQDFETMTVDQKRHTICRLLDMLPSVPEMQEYLRQGGPKELRTWVQRIPPAALDLLRWIIASNRACIMQVDDPDRQGADPGAKTRFKQERLQGMDGYMQFRFAMGAPDKEHRFLRAVKETTDRLNLKYPTIFAWHGSPLYNWHSIIRQGLHYQRTDHGRAYGDGVYHAKDANISLGYSGAFNGGISGGSSTSWKNSMLNIQTALALNELVNAPAEFTSNNPFYVVKQLNWIQTRYLLVRCAAINEKTEEPATVVAHVQDPTRVPTGAKGTGVVIPASAIKSGRVKNTSRQSPNKRLKGTRGEPIVIDLENEYYSEESDNEDCDILKDEVDQTSFSLSQNLLVLGKKKSEQDFVPGMLDYRTLPMMPMPQYATSATTKRLLNELKSLQKTMSSTPTDELGWYIDVENTENMYQWIVELHSFHKLEVKGKPLPLSADMEERAIKSVVLEIRFGGDYPFSPPYVRVVRPRFLSFSEGGGGHIVIGGAMCMELLTNTGWSGINSMESVLMQVRLAIASEPFARLDKRQRHMDYGIHEAADGFIRACRSHGWKEPPGFKEIAYSMK